jgi:DNA (cytosine-5)-methyltransferase 1
MAALTYGSVCSGIEAASVAWHPLGWRASFLSEIEAFPRAVLSHHYPETPLHGDFTTIKAGEYEPIDLLVGGTPCQSFSVAGLRGGLDDDRGNLALEYLRLADRLRPRWLVWENVPGVLSSNGGRDFGAILGGMVELGYGVAYRVLDAQFFGVAQRRRRVFVVGCAGDWRRAAAVLFERHSLSGHPAPRREKGPGVAALTANGVGTCGADDNQGQAGHLISEACADTLTVGANQMTGFASPSVVGSTSVCRTLMAKHTRHDPELESYAIAHTLKGEGFDAGKGGAGRGTPIVPICFSAKDYGADAMSDLSPTLRAGGHSNSHANAGVMPAIAFSIMPMNSGKDFKGRETDVAQPVMAAGPAGGNQGGDYIVQPAIAFALRGRDGGAMPEVEGDGGRIGALRAASGGSSRDYVAGSAVRRLTPRECERLQGFPDDYTLIQYRNGQAADGPRYKALGNSMAVPVMAWIGRRIAEVEAVA